MVTVPRPRPSRQNPSRGRPPRAPDQLSFAFPSPGHTLAGSPPGHLEDASPAAELVRRTCAAQGLPEAVEDARVLARLASLLRRVVD